MKKNDISSKNIKNIFEKVHKYYDLMNDLMSLFLHRIWKKYLLFNYFNFRNYESPLRILDLASGTGDVSIQIYKKLNNDLDKLYLLDISKNMIKKSKNRFLNKGFYKNVFYYQNNAENIPFKNNYFDKITSSFGIRNMIDKSKVFSEIHRVLKPGGEMIILEFSKLNNKVLKKIYNFYCFKIIPKIGKLVANDEKSYEYLVRSIKNDISENKYKKKILGSGFGFCKIIRLSLGIVSIYKAYKY